MVPITTIAPVSATIVVLAIILIIMVPFARPVQLAVPIANYTTMIGIGISVVLFVPTI